MNDQSTANGDTKLTLDAGHGLSVGASFTMAGETGYAPTHYVTKVENTNDITFVPPLALVTGATGILVNDASTSAGDVNITLDAGHGLAKGHTFTIASETGSPRHLVTDVSGNNITFEPALAAGVANDAAITIGVIDNAAITIGTETPGYYADGSSTATLKDFNSDQGKHRRLRLETSISIIDAALDKVAQMRSDLGAIEKQTLLHRFKLNEHR